MVRAYAFFFSFTITYITLVTFPTAPHTEINAKGDIVYTEVVRESVRKLEAYVEQMASGDSTPNVSMQKIEDDVLKLWNVQELYTLFDQLLRDPESSDVRVTTVRSLGVLARYISSEDKREA